MHEVEENGEKSRYGEKYIIYRMSSNTPDGATGRILIPHANTSVKLRNKISYIHIMAHKIIFIEHFDVKIYFNCTFRVISSKFK